jgi:hypothetical protein
MKNEKHEGRDFRHWDCVAVVKPGRRIGNSAKGVWQGSANTKQPEQETRMQRQNCEPIINRVDCVAAVSRDGVIGNHVSSASHMAENHPP